MNPEQLLTHFDRISDAPDAIPRLRRFIFDLAVRGKLVAQDPRDEPASELLKRIQAEKVRLVKAGKIKESQPLMAIDGTKAPYGIPSSWEWVPLGETVNSHLGGGTPSKNNSSYWDGDIFWASVKDVGKGKYIEETIDRITKAGLADSSSNLIPPGNLIIVTRMGLGKLSINRVPIAINQDLRALSLSSLSVIDFHYIFFKTHGFAGTGLTVKGIRVEELLNIAFPLPPLAEQHRIVAKVDELMALCDRLEAAQAERESRRDRLVASSLNRLNNGADAEAFRDHARFNFNHLPSLTTKPEHIQLLRQTILNLAVLGKLTADWRDRHGELGDASNLLAKLEQRHEKAGGHRHGNAAAATEEAHDLNVGELPQSWRITDLRTAVCPDRPITYGILMPGPDTPDGIQYVRVADFPKDRINLATIRRTTKEIENNYARARLRTGDILLSIRGTVGRVCVVPPELQDGNITQDTARLSIQDVLHRDFVMWFLRSSITQQRMQNCSKGVAVRGINIGDVRALQLPVPPLAEQQHIVAKVEELMALCDRLETQLTITHTETRRLLEAVLHDTLRQAPSTDVPVATNSSQKLARVHTTTATTGHPNKHFARTLLSAEIVHQLHAEPTFGRIKHQKILHLCEHIAQIQEVSGEYYRQVAGPLDNRLIYTVETALKKQRWYEEYRRPQYGHGYRPLEKAGGHLKYLERYWPDKLPVIRRLIDIMRTWDTDRCEMFATVYAAWNDLLIWKRDPSDEAILAEVLGRWHERKKRFSEMQWREVITWIRGKGFIPVGFGRPTKQLANP